jgi:flagellar biosynthesis protein FlhB
MASAPSEDRSEEPTEQRAARARQAGDIPQSRELTAGVAFAGACVALIASGKSWAGGLTAYLHTALAKATTATSPEASLRAGLQALLAAAWLPLALLCAAALLAGLAQTRGSFVVGRVRTRAERLVPSLARLLGRERSVDLAVDLAKLGLLGVLCCWILWPCVSGLAGLAGARPERILLAIGVIVERLAVWLALAMVGLGFTDYVMQVVRHRNRLRMTREEARREHKETEGDPEHKAARRRMHIELHMAQGLTAVSRAEVLFLEPGVTAVAISYDGSDASAPCVLVRGERHRMRAIETAARAAGVPSFAEPALVRALAAVDEGEEIPRTLYPVVAERIVRARGLRRGSTVPRGQAGLGEEVGGKRHGTGRQ